MIRLTHLVPASAALLALGIAVASAQPADRQPKAVMELFTSQGCSSCPPADALFAELMEQGALPGIDTAQASQAAARLRARATSQRPHG